MSVSKSPHSLAERQKAMRDRHATALAKKEEGRVSRIKAKPPFTSAKLSRRGNGSIYRPTYTTKDGTKKTASIWWMQWYENGIAIRISSKTKDRAEARKLLDDIISSERWDRERTFQAFLKNISMYNLPPIPMHNRIRVEKGRPLNLPHGVSGVYFVWNGSSVVYIGSSTDLNNRVRTNHPNIFKGDFITFAVLPPEEMMWVESAYIGLLRPKRNTPAHYKSKKRLYASGD